MELTVKNKKEDQFLRLLIDSLKSNNTLHKLTQDNKDSLENLVKYLSKLRKESQISDKQFSELLAIACSNFIENEVSVRVTQKLEKKMLFFFENI